MDENPLKYINAAQSGAKQVPLESIVASLKDMQRQQVSKETEWLFEKSQATQRISQVEGMLRAQESINEDLIKRIKMLEFCLREERVKYAKLMHSINNDKEPLDSSAPVDIIGSVLK